MDELQQSFKEDLIVIVNTTDIGCDAIIVLTSEIDTIALLDMNSSYTMLFFYKSLERYRAINDRQLKKFEQDIEIDIGENDYI